MIGKQTVVRQVPQMALIKKEILLLLRMNRHIVETEIANADNSQGSKSLGKGVEQSPHRG
jgi:hypothetical protein